MSGINYFLKKTDEYMRSKESVPMSVIDDIKAEIKNDRQLKREPSSPYSCGLRHALEIIDKHISGKEKKWIVI